MLRCFDFENFCVHVGAGGILVSIPSHHVVHFAFLPWVDVQKLGKEEWEPCLTWSQSQLCFDIHFHKVANKAPDHEGVCVCVYMYVCVVNKLRTLLAKIL